MSQLTISENLIVLAYPLKLAGCKMGRNVSLIRLNSGKIIIHSTAAFSESDVEAIHQFGEPGWLFEATNFHDTSASVGRKAFPDIPYLVPSGFKMARELEATEFSEPILADQWGDEIEIIPLGGMPKLNETLLFHRESKTLIIADLFFNLPQSAGKWTHWFLGTLMGIKSFPGQSALFRKYITDSDAYRQSLDKIDDLPFENIVVGHGDPLIGNAREQWQKLNL